jgi:hypothetical protein
MSSHARRLLARPVGRPLERLEAREVPATLVSVGADGTSPLNAPVDIIATSDDGRYILFQTKATNVVVGQQDPVGTTDLFWRDVTGNRTELLSGRDGFTDKAQAIAAEDDGTPAPSRSVTLGIEASTPGVLHNAVMSGDGQVVAFLSPGNASRFDIRLDGATDDGGNDVFRWTAKTNFVRLASVDQDGFAAGTYSLVTSPGISAAGNAVGFISTASPFFRFDNKFKSGSKDGVVDLEPLGPNLFVQYANLDGSLDVPRLVTYDGDNLIARNKLDPEDKSSDFFYPYADVSVDPLGRYISDQGFSFVVMRDYRNGRTLLPGQGASGFLPSFTPPFSAVGGGFFGSFVFNQALLAGQTKDAYRFSFAGVGIDPPRQLVEDLLSFGTVGFQDLANPLNTTVGAFQGVSQGGTVLNTFIARDRGDVAVYSARFDPNITLSVGSVGFFVDPEDPDTIEFISGSVTANPLGPYTANHQPVVGYTNQSASRSDLFLARFGAGDTVGFQYDNFLVTGAAGSTSLGQGLAVAFDDFRGTLDTGTRGFSLNSDGSKVTYATTATDVLTGITDKNRGRDVFQYNVVTSETVLVSSRADAPFFTATGDSYNPLTTQDGQLVGFESTAPDLFIDTVNNLRPDNNNLPDIFVRDVATKVTTQASLTPANGPGIGQAGSGKSFNAVLGGTFLNGKLYYTSTALDLTDPPLPPGTPPQTFGADLPQLLPREPRFTAFSGGNGEVIFANPNLNGTFNVLGRFRPFDASPTNKFRGELRVATGDFNGDGRLDVVVGSGPGGGPRVAVLDGGTGRVLKDFFAFEPRFQGGVYVALGDIDGDGRADIIVGAGEGGGPRVQITNAATDKTLMDAFVYESTFRGGARVAAGDVTGDGRIDLVTGAGIGGGPRISVFDGKRLPDLVTYANFFAYEETLRGGAYVSVGDFDSDGKADIATGGGPDGGPRVTVFDANNILVFDPNRRSRFVDFFAFDPDSRNGARPEIKDIDGDGAADLVVGTGNGFPLARSFSGRLRGLGSAAVAAGEVRDRQPGSALLLQTLNPFTEGISLAGAWVG